MSHFSVKFKMPPKRGRGRPRKPENEIYYRDTKDTLAEEPMYALDAEPSVTESDLMRDPNARAHLDAAENLDLSETLIAGRQKRTIKRNIKLETEYYEWGDDNQLVHR